MKLCYYLLCISVVGSFYCTDTEAARILALFHLNVKSHFIMFEKLLIGLAEKGHSVVVVNHFPQKVPITNYTDINVEDSLPQQLNTYTIDYAIKQRWFNLLYFIWDLNVEFCSKVFEHPNFQSLINSQEKFDLVITESFGADCFTGFSHKFQAPLLTLSSTVIMPWSNENFGNPNHPAYIPVFFLPHTDKMDFQTRFFNTLVNFGLELGSYYYAELPTQKLVRKYLGDDMPSLREIARNTSLILVNSHFSLNVPRPMVPGVIEVGGLHIGKLKPLPKDLEKYINESKEGVIYFSLGSLIRSDTLPKEAIRSFLEAFSELPQRVIWKTDTLPDLPKNVITSKWLPQFDILSHPNIRLFITHGGLMGTQEAVYNGVPMVGIPFFSDQHHNIEIYVSKGIAVRLDYYSINKNNVLAAIKSVLHNPKYQEKAKKMSQLFRDRPQSALETAIYWTEYVIRHRGAPHLRSAAVDLPWYQYLLLDVVVVLLLVTFILILTLYYILKVIIKFIFLKVQNREITKNKKI